MEKLYSSKALFVKTSYCASLPLLYPLFEFGTNADSFLALLFAFLTIGCLYTVPFWISVYSLSHNRGNDILRFVLLDLSFCYIPVIVSAIAVDTICEFVSSSYLTGIFALLLIIILLLISGVFWILYKYIGKHNRP